MNTMEEKLWGVSEMQNKKLVQKIECHGKI